MTKHLIFNFEKETKNTCRFQEQVAEGEQYIVGALYIRKDALVDERPNKVIVDIQTEQANEPQI